MTTKNDLRIVFMGTPEFAVQTLKDLIAHNYNIVGVITAPDKPAGRGRKLQKSAIKQYAESQGLTILQPTNLKSEDFIKQLEALQANLQIVVAFRMLPEAVWKMPKHGTFNLHASLLPNYRGAAPIHWAIINGETKTGITTFFIDEKIDTGAIILQEAVAITKDDTTGTLHDKLMKKGAQLVVKTVEQIEDNTITTTIQPKSNHLKTAYKLHKENCKINWCETVEAIHNKIRGLNPFPGAWSYLEDNGKTISVKIYKSTQEHVMHHFECGKLITEKHTLKVAVQNGYIIIEEMQLPNKRKMTTKAILNGYQFTDEAKML